MPLVPREKYPEMNWRAADKVATWKLFKWRMNVVFVADQIPEERQWALILVAGGDEAYNCWDTLEETVKDRKKVNEVWDAFEKSFEQSTSFWHFRDAYLADFRQDELETMADLDLHIKQTVRGCQWNAKCFIRLVACVGSGDPVRVLRLYTTNTLDEVCSIYCWDICTTCRYRSTCYSTSASGPTALSVCSRLCLVANCSLTDSWLTSALVLYCTVPFIATCVDAIGTVFWDRPVLRYLGKALILVAKLLLLL